MRNLIIQGDRGKFFTPNVHFDGSNGACSLSGESYLEDSFAFYEMLINWLHEYFEQKDNLSMNFKLTYFNTSSSRAIIDMLRILKSYREKGKTVGISWYYPDPDDGDLKMEAEDMMEEAGVQMKLIAYGI